MAYEIKMPKLGLTMEKGQVMKWHKEPGDKITEGEVVVEIESDKITNEVKAEKEGYLAQKLIDVGETVPVGEVLGVVVKSKDRISEYANVEESKEKTKKEEITKEEKDDIKETKKETKRKIISSKQMQKFASPRAKKIAEEMDVNLNKVEIKKGPRITSEDVKLYVQEQEEKKIKISPKAQKMIKKDNIDIENVAKISKGPRITSEDVINYKEETSIEKEKTVSKGIKKDLSQMRKTIAERMSSSWEAPHVYLRSEVIVDNLLDIKSNLQQDGLKISFTNLIAYSVVKALEDFPKMNAYFKDNQILLQEDINLGIAVATEKGLVVPVIDKTGELDLKELNKKINNKVKDAKNNKLTLEDFKGGTFTISNLGMYGINEFTAILNPPEVGILAVGKTTEKLVKKEKNIVTQNIIKLTLGIDHRVIDGAVGAKFLDKLKAYIENPALML